MFLVAGTYLLGLCLLAPSSHLTYLWCCSNLFRASLYGTRLWHLGAITPALCQQYVRSHTCLPTPTDLDRVSPCGRTVRSTSCPFPHHCTGQAMAQDDTIFRSAYSLLRTAVLSATDSSTTACAARCLRNKSHRIYAVLSKDTQSRHLTMLLTWRRTDWAPIFPAARNDAT
ncbi:hypothetical protein FA95DRAFT_445402 [Auriscalpium vulgare]|uniref:Uncharacterized protein n=1 Tax=Auriscalpium vulgare TaxID=40419 RepID=A0ACB8RH83_9AGAM|nr:hypothetical protein FA95DRAFT_445402 [Auriscalpium vulgare]